MKNIIILALLLVFIGCELPKESKWCPEDENQIYTTFESISQPVIDKYGLPEDIYKIDDENLNFHAINYYYYSKKIVYSFIDEMCDGWNGWRIRMTGN